MTEYKIMKIKYPDQFKLKIKEVYPEAKEIHAKIENGEEVGSFLNDSTDDFVFLPHMIASTFENEDVDFDQLPDSLQGLYTRAALEMEKQNLFGWYLEISTRS